MAKLDEIDRKLLSLLQDDERLSLAELAEAIGIPASTVNDRIKRMRRNGIITGFHAQVRLKRSGSICSRSCWWAGAIQGRARVSERDQSSPAVLECHHITGTWNYMLKVRVGTTRDLEKFLADVVKSVDGIERTETLIALSSPKETSKVSLPDG